MAPLIDIFLPLSLAFIMFTLGLGLVGADFARVLREPRGFWVGALGQLLLLPLVAAALIWVFGLGGVLAVGFMILALSPGGVTSNLMTHLARGDVALSVSLTALISLVVVVTVPPALGPIMRAYMGASAPDFSLITTALAMFGIVAVPVGLGVAVRRFAPGFALARQGLMTTIATALFVLIVVGALVAGWDLFVTNLASLGPALISLNILMMGFGYVIARLAGLGSAQQTTVSIEVGVQNATIGITVGGLVAGRLSGDETFSAFALASGVYGLTMYAVTLPFVVWRRFSQN